MDSTTINTIELCAGVGMLGEGLAAGLRYMGFDSRCVLYADREAYPCSVLEARMSEGSLAPAPIWCGDFRELPAAEFFGVVDCIAAGFPCQDLSLAGRRAGLDGARSGLFFNILDIADDCNAANLFLENVAGIASATASVVDEAEGALDERAAARVLGELADRGWNAEWLTLSASDVGASHGRSRWFCWAWRMGDTGLQHQHVQQREDGAEHPGTGIQLGHADQQRQQQSHHANGTKSRNQSRAGVGGASCELANTEGDGRNQRRPESSGEQGRSDAAISSESMECEFCGYVYPAGLGLYGCPDCLGEGFDDVDDAFSDGRQPWRDDNGSNVGHIVNPASQQLGHVAHTSSPGQQGAELGRACDGNGGGQEAHGPTSQLCGLFAPGPADPRWAGILADRPELAPALEPTFRSVVNGLAFNMDDSRAPRLKCVGNGVVALCAATAFVVLIKRSGVKFQ